MPLRSTFNLGDGRPIHDLPAHRRTAATENVLMKPRAVRIPLVEARVTFNGVSVGLVNISRTGALLAADSPQDIGTAGSLVVTHAHTTVTIDGRIVRANDVAAGRDGDDRGRHIAIEFTAPPPDEITALLRRVVSPRVLAADRIRV
jgi:hypothetical protein